MRTEHRALAFEKLLHDAEHTMRSAEQNAYAWADVIRQGAERRLGIDAADERALDDSIYNRALALCSRLAEIADAATEALAEQQAIAKANKEA